MSLDDFDALLPSSENIFKQPDQFHSLDIPEFSHFPIEDGNFGDLEFLDLASDRLLSKNKNPGQFSDIYFNSIATPSGYCSANYLTEEANRLSLLLSESGEREKGEMLDKTLIENLEEIFGVGSHSNKDSYAIDEQLPSVLGSLERKASFGVEFEVPNDVLNIMAKNFENLEDLNKDSREESRVTASSAADKTITIKSVRNHNSSEPPPGAVAKIILSSSKKMNMTKIVFSSMDDKEQHSFSLNTSNMRCAAECLRNYNLDNMEALRRLLKLDPLPKLNPPIPQTNNQASNIQKSEIPSPTLQQTAQVHSPENENINSRSIRKHTDIEKPTNILSQSIQQTGIHTTTNILSQSIKQTGMHTTTNKQTHILSAPMQHTGFHTTTNIQTELLQPSIKQSNIVYSNQVEGILTRTTQQIDLPTQSNKKTKILATIIRPTNILGSTDKQIDIDAQTNLQTHILPQISQPTNLLSPIIQQTSIHIPFGKQTKIFQNLNQSCDRSIVDTEPKPQSHSHPPAPSPVSLAEEDYKGGEGSISRRIQSSPAKILQADLAAKGIIVEIGNVEVDGQSYLCCPYDGCAKAYSIGYELKLHIMKHFKLQPFECDHPGCTWSFVTAFKLQRHKKTHSKEKSFICTYNDCSKAFTTLYNLTVHVKAHGRLLEHVCGACSEGFTTFKQLELHIGRLHPNEMTPGYLCEYPGCDKKYFSLNHLVSHKRFHAQNYLVCKVESCRKQFTKASHLRIHEVSHSDERRYACDHDNCSARFKTTSKLSRHKKIHNKTNPLICDVCPKKFYRDEHFRAHRLTHSDIRTFQCLHQFCDKRFGGRVLLLDHIRKVHKREKTSSLLCPILDCSKRFISRISFESHLSHHEKDLQDNTLHEAQDSSQLDFVALLSSVGEDILLPDELACPEYEVSSDHLGDKNRIRDTQPSSIFRAQDYVVEQLGVEGQLVAGGGQLGAGGGQLGAGGGQLGLGGGQLGAGGGQLGAGGQLGSIGGQLVDISGSLIKHEVSRLTVPDPDQILISIQQPQHKSMYATDGAFTFVQSGVCLRLQNQNEVVSDEVGMDVTDGDNHQFHERLVLPPLNSAVTNEGEVVHKVEGTSSLQGVCNNISEDNCIDGGSCLKGDRSSGLKGMDVLVTNRLEVVGVSNVMEEVVDVAYSYMDTSEQQQNLGISLCNSGDGVYTADPILKHSTINLQDLK